MTDKKELELYLHIPFCIRKCNYCDFLSMPADEGVYIQYADMLLEELKEKASVCREYQAITVFLGGGTPSLLPEGQISRILGGVQEYFSLSPNAEVTIECNPGTLDRQKLSAYQKSGVNRLSIGLQSAINQELGLLGRIHTFQQFEENFALARDIGFQNINIDLISGLPRQTLRDWEYTLEKVMDLEPEHISAYSLIVEPGTPFYETYGEDEQRREQGGHPQYLPEEETERDMYQRTKALLEEKGYRRYEISNYAQDNFECEHNKIYWRTTMDYLGLGLGAHSFQDGRRSSNPVKWQDYVVPLLNNILPKREEETLTVKEAMAEMIFMGLRMNQGVSLVEFEQRFDRKLVSVYEKAITKCQKNDWLTLNEGYLRLTEKGRVLGNLVFVEFV